MVWRHSYNVVSVPGNLMTPKTAGRFAEWSREGTDILFQFPLTIKGFFPYNRKRSQRLDQCDGRITHSFAYFCFYQTLSAAGNTRMEELSS